jgi:GTP1/Obg family GTP-binding protein
LRFCRYRRKTLQRHPKLRYFDPFYTLSMALTHRLRMLRQVLATRNGARYMLSQILAPGNYMRLCSDLMEGRGR